VKYIAVHVGSDRHLVQLFDGDPAGETVAVFTEYLADSEIMTLVDKLNEEVTDASRPED
jgi:hypothetical protein